MMSKRIKVVAFTIIIIIGAFFLLRSLIGDYFLKKNGKCINAVLVGEQSRVRSRKATLLFEFNYGGKKYDGN